jgi:hypothetical protein
MGQVDEGDKMNLDQDVSYLRACLTEMETRLAYPGASSAIEIVQNGHVAAAILLCLARLGALEKRINAT